MAVSQCVGLITRQSLNRIAILSSPGTGGRGSPVIGRRHAPEPAPHADPMGGSSYAVHMSDVATRPLRKLVDARREEIRAIVARHGGQSVAVFGSVARGGERPDSDIDFLVELAPDARPFEILAIGAELEEALGVRVDVGTPGSLRARVRDEVLAEAVPL